MNKIILKLHDKEEMSADELIKNILSLSKKEFNNIYKGEELDDIKNYSFTKLFVSYINESNIYSKNDISKILNSVLPYIFKNADLSYMKNTDYGMAANEIYYYLICDNVSLLNEEIFNLFNSLDYENSFSEKQLKDINKFQKTRTYIYE